MLGDWLPVDVKTSHTSSWDLVVIGGGIVGLAIARAWKTRNPNDSIVVVDKEDRIAAHSSGRNSGVLHAGFYYAPDSLKARLTREGNAQLRAFCHEHGVLVRETGKVVVTTSESQLTALGDLYQRGIANGCTLEIVDEKQTTELEPRARTIDKAIWSPLTAVANPISVTEALARHVVDLGCQLRLGVKVVRARAGQVDLETGEHLIAGHIVNAAGLYADKVAHWFDVGLDYRMLPFKGLYLYDANDSVKLSRQVYPVPNPDNPFLGVHVTTTAEGRTKIGPTAIPALRREDYGSLWKLHPRELSEVVRLYPRFLTSPHHRVAQLIASEVPKYGRGYLVRQAQKLVPSLDKSSLSQWGTPGVRAQLLHVPSKQLVMDFLVRSGPGSTHMLNVVSPAWTSALAVGDYTVAGIHSTGFPEES